MRINNNVSAFNAYRNLSQSQGAVGKSLERLSSGLRINRAADDAAGLVNSENLRSKIGGLKVATRNAQDAISVVQTAEGALTEVHTILQRMRDLAVHAANTGGNDSASSTADQAEVDDLVAELNRIATQTKYGNKALLDGSASVAASALTFQVGADAGQNVAVTVGAAGATALALNTVTVTSATFAAQAIASVDAAISTISAQRADLGAFQNRMESTIRNLSVTTENLTAAESRIRDADMALEMTSFTRNQIMQQAGTAMLAQANAAPQSVLSLLR